MPKIHVKKQSVSLDMTAMCDVAFLLLTFFMLTAKMKPQDPVQVTTPTSVAKAKPTDKDLITISVGKDGKIFWGTDNQGVRVSTLEAMGTKYGITFTEAEKEVFRLSEAFGAPMTALKQLLNTDAAQRNKPGFQPGMPCDSAHNELFEWVYAARQRNPLIKIVVKGDGASDYKVMKQIVGSLQEQNINQFYLLTGLETKPKGEE
jgi:biopolymer transport protein ExbD